MVLTACGAAAPQDSTTKNTKSTKIQSKRLSQVQLGPLVSLVILVVR